MKIEVLSQPDKYDKLIAEFDRLVKAANFPTDEAAQSRAEDLLFEAAANVGLFYRGYRNDGSLIFSDNKLICISGVKE